VTDSKQPVDPDERDPADRASSWEPDREARESEPDEVSRPEATHEEWDRLLDEADAPPPGKRDPRDHPDVPDSARRLLRDDTAAG
jgi:hypothetical protein